MESSKYTSDLPALVRILRSRTKQQGLSGGPAANAFASAMLPPKSSRADFALQSGVHATLSCA
jgi:hypothetical protein